MLGKTADEVMKKYKFSEHYSKVGKFNFFEFKDGNNSLFFGFDTNATELKGNEKCTAILADFTKIFKLAKEVYRLSSDNLAYMLGAKKASVLNDAKLKKALDEKRLLHVKGDRFEVVVASKNNNIEADDAGVNIIDTVIANLDPDDEAIEQLKALGAKLAG